MAILFLSYLQNFNLHKKILTFELELGMEDTLGKLQALDGDLVASVCRKTLTMLVQNAMENVENKIYEVLDIIGEKVRMFYNTFLLEGYLLI